MMYDPERLGYERSSDTQELLPELLGLSATRLAYAAPPLWWEYFALDCQRVMRHQEAELDRLRALIGGGAEESQARRENLSADTPKQCQASRRSLPSEMT